MKEAEMVIIADLMCRVISDHKNDAVLAEVKEEARKLCEKFPLYPELRQ
jgi:glycine hydroxymethyltransferase